MNMKIQFIRLSVFAMLCFLQATYAQSGSENETKDKNNILLLKNELSGLVIQRTVERPWITGIVPSAKPHSSHGVLQEIEIEGIKARIHYAEFDSNDAARQAADFHVHNMASIFKKGLWDGARHKPVGDETWHTHGPITLAVLVRSGKTCILISCRNGDFESKLRIAEKLAKHLTNKAKQGAHVPVSETLP